MWFCSQAHYCSFSVLFCHFLFDMNPTATLQTAEKLLFPRRELELCRLAEPCEGLRAGLLELCQRGWRGGRTRSPLTPWGQQRGKPYPCWPEVGSAGRRVANGIGMDAWMDGKGTFLVCKSCNDTDHVMACVVFIFTERCRSTRHKKACGHSWSRTEQVQYKKQLG